MNWLLPFGASVGLVVLVGLAALPARAQTAPECVSLPDALVTLETRYDERPRVSGLTSGGHLLILTASETGAWSALLVSPDGQACMVAAGVAFEVAEPKLPGVDG